MQKFLKIPLQKGLVFVTQHLLLKINRCLNWFDEQLTSIRLGKQKLGKNLCTEGKLMKKLGLILASACLFGFVAQPVLASDAGKKLYASKQCATCHQPAGKGTGPFPKLAGKDAAFLQEQFVAIQTGKRATGMSATMKANPGVASTTAEEIAAIAGYLSKL